MKIIATSIVLLAAAASAGDSSLRSGRKLPVDAHNGGNGNGNGPTTDSSPEHAGTGLGFTTRCCAEFDGKPGTETEFGCANATISNCDIDNLDDTKFHSKFLANYNGCTYNATAGECIHDEDE